MTQDSGLRTLTPDWISALNKRWTMTRWPIRTTIARSGCRESSLGSIVLGKEKLLCSPNIGLCYVCLLLTFITHTSLALGSSLNSKVDEKIYLLKLKSLVLRSKSASCYWKVESQEKQQRVKAVDEVISLLARWTLNLKMYSLGRED